MGKILLIISALMATTACINDKTNPLLRAEFDTPHQTPPFDRVAAGDFLEAMREGIRLSRSEVAAITANTDEPTFANTIEAFARQGALLDRATDIFFSLRNAETSDAMDAAAEAIIPELTELSNDISLDERLFARIAAVYDKREGLGLDTEQMRLLEKTYKGFVRGGAGLQGADRDKYREISGELSMLSLRFGQNVLAATNAYELNIPPADSSKLEDMPGFVVEAMAEAAAAKGRQGWTVTLDMPSYLPFMTYCKDRELKRQLWTAYGSRCYGDGPNDNREIVKRTAELRLQLARLLGYDTYADYVVERRMAGSVSAIEGLLSELLTATRRFADSDFNMIKEYARDKDGLEDLQPWDWAYYEEKCRADKYDLNQEELKPYFKLENAEKGLFVLAGKLYGLTFVENRDIPVYHPDVKVFEVYDSAGKFMAVLYMDYFPRPTKKGGAWMTGFREMRVEADGTEVRPLVSVCCNFTKPTATMPSLLTFDEVETLLHEFGHALHGILAEGRYASMTGTSVYRDFVELPSQIMENWATEKEFLDLWAKHYQTGEPIPADMVAKIVASRKYLEPYRNVRQLSFGMNDMAWHTITSPVEGDIREFEIRAMEGTQFFAPRPETCMSTAFSHIFAGGYAAGYYSYKWAEVLEADAFSLFRERGIFDRETADSFRRNILSRGDTEDPMTLYVRFRGHKPEVGALIDKILRD